EEPKRVHQALKDPSLIEAMQEELLQFKMQKVWVLVDLPHGKRAIGKSASTPIDTEKPLLNDPDGEDVDVHTYMSMIGSLMYLTSSRPDIIFAVNDITRLQALVDKKKVVVTKAAIREVLRLDNAEGVNCLSNEEIFIELARIGKQVGDLSTYTTKYTSPTLTQKVFANMRRVGKGFFRVETPLFEGMLVGQEFKEEKDKDEHVEDSYEILTLWIFNFYINTRALRILHSPLPLEVSLHSTSGLV
nr:ribonuclease H-like domain, reverse transcriptase, RNA-dependent DNA polymerase [Tanacetum cinerariifolium]